MANHYYKFLQPALLSEANIDSFVEVDEESVKNYPGIWIKIVEFPTDYGDCDYDFYLYSGRHESSVQFNGWSLKGRKSAICRKWKITLFFPRIIDPLGNEVEFGNCINQPDVFMMCYNSGNNEIQDYLCCMFKSFARIAVDFVNAEHFYLYDNHLNTYYGNTFGNRMAAVLKYLNGGLNLENPSKYRNWLDEMIARCKQFISASDHPDAKIEAALARYEEVRARFR